RKTSAPAPEIRGGGRSACRDGRGAVCESPVPGVCPRGASGDDGAAVVALRTGRAGDERAEEVVDQHVAVDRVGGGGVDEGDEVEHAACPLAWRRIGRAERLWIARSTSGSDALTQSERSIVTFLPV